MTKACEPQSDNRSEYRTLKFTIDGAPAISEFTNLLHAAAHYETENADLLERRARAGWQIMQLRGVEIIPFDRAKP